MDSEARPHHWIGLGVLVAGLAVGCASVPKLEPARSDLSRRMMDYYKTPDFTIVEALIEELDEPPTSTDRGARPPVIGFLAAIFEANPHRVPAILSREYGRSGQAIVALSLHYSGEAQRAAEYLQRNGWAQQTIDDLGRYPPALEAIVITRPDDLDLLWGAFFASGGLEHVSKILAFAHSPSKLGVPLRDVLAIAILSIDAHGKDSSGVEAQRLRGRYSRLDEEGVQQVLLATTAMWAIGSNAKQHPLISDYLKQRIAQSPNADNALFLRWAVFQQEYPNSVAIQDGESVLATMITVRSLDAAQALAQEWSVENLEAGGTREIELGTPPIVLQIIYNKLRCDGEYFLVLTEPGGAIREYAHSPLDIPGAESSRHYNITTLAPDGFQVAGSYDYSLRITACGEEVPPISNGFFVY